MHDDLNRIIERNERVGLDKAWERSLTRRGIITVGTYIVIGGYLHILNVHNAWLHAVVPAMAYLISTLCLSRIKPVWIKYIYKAKEEPQKDLA